MSTEAPVLRRAPGPWLHYGVVPAPSVRAKFYAELRSTAQELLAADEGAADFFFLHKPPGLRVRFRVPGPERAGVDRLLRERLTRWRSGGLLLDWTGGVYEPEEYLFGGPVSLRSVHRIFTADSLAWLGFHRSGLGSRAAWAMSLVMVRDLLDALDIVGWEDLDVWDRLRRQTGRRYADGAEPPEEAERIAEALRAGWADPGTLARRLPAGAVEYAEEFRRAVVAAGERWRGDYFTVGDPAVGPREAAAFVIVFHWNRAGLSLVRQTLIAEALTVRPGGGVK
ncbi:thiopeptide-type bacteriocin biosynthesis protein [Streptomyces violascens]|uniref:thiopeptide-type bacteriocin biosynthesis protein n=1 Tax=Streptomyces violascens TaxID=67381 RepID=UPI0036BB459D